MHAAIEAGLELIPVLNKVDLPGMSQERVTGEIVDLIGPRPLISAKTGEGVRDVLEAIVERIPPPAASSTRRPGP